MNNDTSKTSIDVPETDDKQALDYLTTDTANAERLIADHGKDYLYCNALGGWLHWKGRRWSVDNSAIYEAAKDVGRTLLRESADTNDRHEQDALIRHAKYSLGERGIRSMVNLAATDHRISVGPEIFDSDHYLLNVANGTVDVRTGERNDHRREDYITKLADVIHDPHATAPLWLEKVQRWLPDEQVREYVQKAIGQALTGTVEQQALYVNHGFGENGKSTFFDTVFSVFGDYAGTVDMAVLMETNRGSGATPEIMALKGKRLVVASESERGSRLKESLIKRLTGDKTFTGRHLYKEVMTFTRTFKLFMHVNHRPEITGTDHAIWRRLKLVPWEVRITKAEKDVRLLDKLEDELSGILNWLLDGYLLYERDGLESPEAVQAATDQYRADMDKVGQFIKDECVTSVDKLFTDGEIYAIVDDLYEAYKKWCGDNGVWPEKKRTFGERMMEKRYEQKVKKIAGKSKRVWLGIGLLAE